MRLPGRIAAAIEILEDMNARHRPVAEALKAWGLNHRFAGVGDRSAIGNLVYDTQRSKLSHAYAMREGTPRALVLSVIVREWGVTPEELNDQFASDAHAPAILSVDEVQHLSAPAPLAGAAPHIAADVPEWTVPSLERTFGSDWVAEATAMTRRPSLDLRVNTLRADRPRLLKALERFSARPGDIAPTCMRIETGGRDARTPNVQAEEGYLKGLFEVQDQGSQVVAALVGAQPGEQVLDLCAGAGGKTLAMAAAMANKGQIFAYDSDRFRLAPIYDRLKRSGVRNVQVRAPGEGALDDLTDALDRVVIDAPCTGTGTWRRRPDTKWKLTPEQVAARVADQRALLERAVTLVKPAGTIAYITCSVLDEENDAQIADFLARHGDFATVDLKPAVGALGEAAPRRVRMTRTGGVLLTPLRSGTDGFFIALLKRKR